MIDLTEGWAWFVGGLSATLLVMLALFTVVLFARRSEQRTRAHRR